MNSNLSNELEPFTREILSSEDKEWWKIHKPELYGITGLIISDVTDSALQKASLKIDEPTEYSNPYLNLKNQMDNAMITELQALVIDINSRNDHPRKQALHRLDELLNQVILRNIRTMPSAINSEIFIRGGITNATDLMSNVLQMIPELVKDQLPKQYWTPKAVSKIAQNSYPLIASFASSQFHSFVNARAELKDQPAGLFHNLPYNKEYFLLQKNRDNFRVVIRPEMLNYLQGTYGFTQRDSPHFEEDVVACPAFENQSIHKLYNGMTNSAEAIYQMEFS